jgi:hypothetical protein
MKTITAHNIEKYIDQNINPKKLPEVINHTLLWLLSFFPPTHPGFSILGEINFVLHPVCCSVAFERILFDRPSQGLPGPKNTKV